MIISSFIFFTKKIRLKITKIGAFLFIQFLTFQFSEESEENFAIFEQPQCLYGYSKKVQKWAQIMLPQFQTVLAQFQIEITQN